MRGFFMVSVLAAAFATSAAAQDGKALYDQHCKKCHGATGTPSAVMTKKFPKLKAFDLTKSDADITKAFVDGKGDDMKGFGSKIESAADRKALLAYIRTLK